MRWSTFSKKDLLEGAINFARKYDNISDNEKHIILHAKKSLLYNDRTPWCKRDNSEFDLTMGSYDGVEICLVSVVRAEVDTDLYEWYCDSGHAITGGPMVWVTACVAAMLAAWPDLDI
ncbi:hypothetical protein ScPMuIL_007799 [Solemya velum]